MMLAALVLTVSLGLPPAIAALAAEMRRSHAHPDPAPGRLPGIILTVKDIVMLNTAQVMVFVRQLLLIGGGMLVARGIIDQGALSALVDNAVTAISALIVIATVVYGIWRDRSAGAVGRAASLPEVKQIVASPALADKVPSDKVVPPNGR